MKPILIVGMYSTDRKLPLKIEKKLYERLQGEYHVVVYFNNEIDQPTFQVFYEKDHKPIDIEGLKELIRNNQLTK